MVRDHRSSQPSPADQFGQQVVVRQVRGQGLEASDGVQGGAPQRERGAEPERGGPQGVGHEHRRQEPLVDLQRSQPSDPVGADSAAAVQAGHDSGRPIEERCDDPSQIVPPHADVAVGDDQVRVLGVLEHVGQVADLEVGPDDALVHVDADVALGKFRDEPSRDLERRIRGVLQAEHDLKLRIILVAERTEVLVQLGFQPAQRLKDGDRGQLGRLGEPAPAPTDQGEQGARQIGQRRHRGEQEGYT
jgi:hypothetical protein